MLRATTTRLFRSSGRTIGLGRVRPCLRPLKDDHRHPLMRQVVGYPRHCGLQQEDDCHHYCEWLMEDDYRHLSLREVGRHHLLAGQRVVELHWERELQVVQEQLAAFQHGLQVEEYSSGVLAREVPE